MRYFAGVGAGPRRESPVGGRIDPGRPWCSDPMRDRDTLLSPGEIEGELRPSVQARAHARVALRVGEPSRPDVGGDAANTQRTPTSAHRRYRFATTPHLVTYGLCSPSRSVSAARKPHASHTAYPLFWNRFSHGTTAFLLTWQLEFQVETAPPLVRSFPIDPSLSRQRSYVAR